MRLFAKMMLGACAVLGIGVLSGCGMVRPTADRLAELSVSSPERVSSQLLVRRGFERLENMGGPQLRSGECYEKVAVGAFGFAGGVDIVRVCFDSDGPIIFKRHTHGCPWHEIFPNRVENCWDGPNISDETEMRLFR